MQCYNQSLTFQGLSQSLIANISAILDSHVILNAHPQSLHCLEQYSKEYHEFGIGAFEINGYATDRSSIGRWVTLGTGWGYSFIPINKIGAVCGNVISGEQCFSESDPHVIVNNGSRIQSNFFTRRFSAIGSISIALERPEDPDFVWEFRDSTLPSSIGVSLYFSSMSMVARGRMRTTAYRV